jgi:hypothetical protein
MNTVQVSALATACLSFFACSDIAEDPIILGPTAAGGGNGGEAGQARAGTAGFADGPLGGTGGTGGAAGGPPCGQGGGCTSLLPPEGYIRPTTIPSPCTIVGAWYTFGCPGAVFGPEEGSPVSAKNGAITFAGSVPAADPSAGSDASAGGEGGSGPDFSIYYGAVIGFDVCGMPGDMSTCLSWLPEPYCAWPPESKHTVDECSLNLNYISFNITGVLPSTELRVVFKERDREESAYLVVPDTGFFCGTIADARVEYDPYAPPLNLGQVESIHFQVTTAAVSAQPFSFEIRDLAIR